MKNFSISFLTFTVLIGSSTVKSEEISLDTYTKPIYKSKELTNVSVGLNSSTIRNILMSGIEIKLQKENWNRFFPFSYSTYIVLPTKSNALGFNVDSSYLYSAGYGLDLDNDLIGYYSEKNSQLVVAGFDTSFILGSINGFTSKFSVGIPIYYAEASFENDSTSDRKFSFKDYGAAVSYGYRLEFRTKLITPYFSVKKITTDSLKSSSNSSLQRAMDIDDYGFSLSTGIQYSL